MGICMGDTKNIHNSPLHVVFFSLIEWHIETHIEDSFPVSSGFVSLNETQIED